MGAFETEARPPLAGQEPAGGAESDSGLTTGRHGLPTGEHNENPSGLSLWALWREDLEQHYGSIWEQGFWALAVHRFGNWRMGIRPKLLRIPFSLLYKMLNKVVEWTCGISLPYTVKVGRRVRIWHHGGMILHAESIGDDVHIRQNTTMGVARTDHNSELPRIGDRADIGCHVCILGKVTVGEGAVIGAGAVVLHDIPPNSVAVGAPARVVKGRDSRRNRLGDDRATGEPTESSVGPKREVR